MASHDWATHLRYGRHCSPEIDALIARRSARQNCNFRGAPDTLQKRRFPRREDELFVMGIRDRKPAYYLAEVKHTPRNGEPT